jgi:hypothetical protein
MGGKTVFTSQERQSNFGLLFMRLGLAAVLLIHSLPRLFAGSPSWQSVGITLGFINIGVPQTILGFVDCLYYFVYPFCFIFFQLFPYRLPDLDAVYSRTCVCIFRPDLCGTGAVLDRSKT